MTSEITVYCGTRRWQTLSALFCFLYGIVFIVNIQPVGDGSWFWYATLLRESHSLYGSMHFPLQPLFVLLTAWTQDLFGNGWLASKILAVAQLFAYCAALWLIAGFIPWKDWQKAVLIAAVYGMTITAFYTRFDDYHITGYCFEAYSIYLLLSIYYKECEHTYFRSSVLLGILSGLSMSNRLNDGVALFAACCFALIFFIEKKRLLVLLLFCATSALTFLTIILLTGDTIREWALNSIISAASIKGGAKHVLVAPLTLPVAMYKILATTRRMIANLGFAFFLAVIVNLIPQHTTAKNHKSRLIASTLWATFVLALPFGIWQARTGRPNTAIAAFSVLVLYLLSGWVLLRMFLSDFKTTPPGRSRLEVLLFIPFLQLQSGAMTSGNSVLETYAPVAFLLLLLPISSPIRIRRMWQLRSYLAIAGFIAVSSLIAKAEDPYSWHHFVNRPFFIDRVWYKHPVYGSMYIERDQLQFISSICDEIKSNVPVRGLLSITNPYPNYFCNVAPWHGYVQTWYDTTSPQTIHALIHELDLAPPEWVVYQRDLAAMHSNEIIYNHGLPLPHRELDRLIMNKIANRSWTVVKREWFEGADWILIRTQP